MILPVEAVPPHILPRQELAALNVKIAEAGKKAGQQAAAADSRPGAGPIVLGLFMACILLNCLIYLIHESRDFWAELHSTSFKNALVHDYRDNVAAPAARIAMTAPVSAPSLAMPEDSWHQVAPGGDADELRTALRLAYASRTPRIVRKWRNETTGHHGTVTPISLDSDMEGCRRFRITRASNSYDLSDNVDFCADGSIRQGLK